VNCALVVYGGPGAVELLQDPRCLGGLTLPAADSATTVRNDSDEPVASAGAYGEVGKALTGFYLFEVADRDEAVDIASRIPAARLGGSVEIRTLVQL